VSNTRSGGRGTHLGYGYHGAAVRPGARSVPGSPDGPAAWPAARTGPTVMWTCSRTCRRGWDCC